MASTRKPPPTLPTQSMHNDHTIAGDKNATYRIRAKSPSHKTRKPTQTQHTNHANNKTSKKVVHQHTIEFSHNMHTKRNNNHFCYPARRFVNTR